MTNDEQALMKLSTGMLIALLRLEYVQNMNTGYDEPGLKEKLDKANEDMLDNMARMAALQSRINEPGVDLPMDLLMAAARSEIVSSIRREMEEMEEYIKKSDPGEELKDLMRKIRDLGKEDE